MRWLKYRVKLMRDEIKNYLSVLLYLDHIVFFGR